MKILLTLSYYLSSIINSSQLLSKICHLSSPSAGEMITEWLQGTSGDHIVQAKSGEETLLEAYGEKIDPGSLSGL